MIRIHQTEEHSGSCVALHIIKPILMIRILLLIVISTTFFSFSVSPHRDYKTISNNLSDSPEVKKKIRIKKNVVKIYPNPSFGRINISATTTQPLHFYIFDLEGTLIYQAVLKNKDRKNIDNLKKGTYMYDVFENDESIEEGKIIVK
jgi:hypothetical protein